MFHLPVMKTNKQTKIASYIPAISHQNPSGRVGLGHSGFSLWWVFSLWSHTFLFSFSCNFPNFSKDCFLARETLKAWDVQGICTIQNNKDSWKHGGWERETPASCATEIAASFDSHRGECSLCCFIRLHFPNCSFSLICSQGFNHKFSTARVSNSSSSSSLSLSPAPRKKNTKASVRYRKRTSRRWNRPSANS